jgi:hypothetical protein
LLHEGQTAAERHAEGVSDERQRRWSVAIGLLRSIRRIAKFRDAPRDRVPDSLPESRSPDALTPMFTPLLFDASALFSTA